jgi:hypothetical protein
MGGWKALCKESLRKVHRWFRNMKTSEMLHYEQESIENMTNRTWKGNGYQASSQPTKQTVVEAWGSGDGTIQPADVSLSNRVQRHFLKDCFPYWIVGNSICGTISGVSLIFIRNIHWKKNGPRLWLVHELLKLFKLLWRIKSINMIWTVHGTRFKRHRTG